MRIGTSPSRQPQVLQDAHGGIRFVERIEVNAGSARAEQVFALAGGILDAEFGGTAQDPWGNQKAGFTVSGKVNRQDFGLVWNAPLEAGGVLLGNDVKLNVELQVVKG